MNSPSPSVHLGYLSEWLIKNKAKIWKKPPKSIRFCSQRAISLEQQNEFEQLGTILVKRLTQGERFNKPTLFAILDLNALNAYAVWPAHCYGVLPTNGLIDQIQKICGQIAGLMKQHFALQDPEDFPTKLWGELPRDDSHLEALGGLVAQIAFTFIVHHELAHIGLGHERIIPGARASAGSATESCNVEGDLFIDESEYSAAASSK